MAPLLRVSRQPPDNIDDYRQDFGYIGPALQAAVTRVRAQTSTPVVSSSTALASAAGTTLLCINVH